MDLEMDLAMEDAIDLEVLMVEGSEDNEVYMTAIEGFMLAIDRK
jgi:hypothetical protein